MGYEVRETSGRLPLWELSDSAGGSVTTIAPGRGGMATRLQLAGQELFFLDEETLFDPAKNVRGGCPVLFPTPGKLVGGHFAHEGRDYAMNQHGFARNLPWQVIGHEVADSASLLLRLESSDATRAQYPFDFVLDYRYSLRGDALRIEQSVTNRGPVPMPFAAGFHPYFLVPQRDKAEARIPTTATRALDNAAGQEMAFHGFDLTAQEVDLHLLDHRGSSASLARPGAVGRIEVSASAEYAHWVVWTLAGRDFVCLEPWTAPGNALNTGDRVICLAPGHARQLFVEIAYR